MASYVSMLRAINVGGAKKVPMKDLAALYESLGFENVRTYIQSGNVVFEAPEQTPTNLEKQIEAGVAGKFGFDTRVLVRTSDEVASVVQGNPYPEDQRDKVLVAFLSGPPESPDFDRIDRYRAPEEEYELVGREMFLHFPNGMGRSKMTNAVLERALGVVTTVRNWRTVNKLLEMAKD